MPEIVELPGLEDFKVQEVKSALLCLQLQPTTMELSAINRTGSSCCAIGKKKTRYLEGGKLVNKCALDFFREI